MSPLRVVMVDDHNLFREGTAELLTIGTDIEVVGQGIRSTVRTLQRDHPTTAVVVLTMHEDPALVRDLLACGARAFLSKSSGRAELIAVVQSVGTQSDTVVLSVSRDTADQLDRSSSPLSERELEVLTLLADAKSNAVIGKELHIAEGTVKRHLTNIYAKLGATSRMDAVRKAFTSGLLSTVQR